MTESHSSARRHVGLRKSWIVLIATSIVTANAFADSALFTLTLPSGSTQMALGEHMRVFGVPIDTRVFTIPQPLVAAARALAEQYPVLSDVTVFPDGVLLTGRASNQRWLVRLEANGPEATVGSLSTIREADAIAMSSEVHAPSARDADAPAWLPKGGQRMLDLVEQAEGQASSVTQQVWSYALPAATLWLELRRGLVREQWQTDTTSLHLSQWRRNRSLLVLSVVERKDGSGLWWQHYQGDTP